MLTPRRGLLLVYDSQVFADTSEDVDEVTSPRFFVPYNIIRHNN